MPSRTIARNLTTASSAVSVSASGAGVNSESSSLEPFSMKPGSRWKPVRVSAAKRAVGRNFLMIRRTSKTSLRAMVRAETILSASRSHTTAPLEQITVPVWPSCSSSGCSQRGGRPVTKTSSTPASRQAWKARMVRSLIFPSCPRIVPSMSLATSRMLPVYVGTEDRLVHGASAARRLTRRAGAPSSCG